MDNLEKQDLNVKDSNTCKDWNDNHNHRAGKVVAGLFVVTAGALLLAREMGTYIPEWVFSWPMLVVAIGLVFGAKHSFRHAFWLVPVLIGGAFLADRAMPEISLTPYLWPIAIILIGLFIVFKPRRSKHHHWRKWDRHHTKYQGAHYDKSYRAHRVDVSSDDRIDLTAVFAGINKNIVSADFKGGEITCFFGGAEISLSQANINGRVELDITQVFGGTKLVVPPHWKVESEIVAIMAGVEDKRPIQSLEAIDASKVLVLKGTSVFGGIELRS